MSKSNRNPGTRVFHPEAGAEPFPGYKLVRLRGRGGFATVWEASSPSGEHIALKFMSSQGAIVAAREIRSIQAMQALAHPNLTRIHQVWSMPGQIVIGMELGDASLFDLMMLYHHDLGQHIDTVKLFAFLDQVARALDFLNARRHTFEGRTVGYQHADIKPNNVLLFGDTVKLCDYGLSAPTAGGNTPCHRQGTAEYAAPEVFQGYLAESSDQYSLAVTYYLLRTGAFPFPPPPQPGAPMKGYVRPAPDLSLLPEPERPVLNRALSPIPINRYPTCGEFVAGLYSVNGLSIPEGLVQIRRKGSGIVQLTDPLGREPAAVAR